MGRCRSGATSNHRVAGDSEEEATGARREEEGERYGNYRIRVTVDEDTVDGIR